jgi:hypothetical protein
MTKTDVIQLLADIFSETNCSFKVKLTNKPLTSNWDKMFIRPEESYVEFGQTGPVRISEVESIEINPIEQIHIGARVPDRYHDHTDLLKNYFQKNLIKYSIDNKTIRVIIADT